MKVLSGGCSEPRQVQGAICNALAGALVVKDPDDRDTTRFRFVDKIDDDVAIGGIE
jgi:hypothetical protein